MQSMREIGLKINRMDLEKKVGLMVQYLRVFDGFLKKDTTNWARRKVREN